jgi:uncharacterized membrane protein YhaH (DUF805 family)
MNKVKLTWLLLFTLLMMVAMKVQWNIANSHTAQGIIPLELAKTHAGAKVITADWNIPGAIENTYLDFAFIIVYSLFLFFGVYRLADRLKYPENLLKYLAWLAPLAAILDFIENYKMLIFLNDANSFESAYTASILKWGIVALLFLMFIYLSCRVNDYDRKKIKY